MNPWIGVAFFTGELVMITVLLISFRRMGRKDGGVV